MLDSKKNTQKDSFEKSNERKGIFGWIWNVISSFFFLSFCELKFAITKDHPKSTVKSLHILKQRQIVIYFVPQQKYDGPYYYIISLLQIENSGSSSRMFIFYSCLSCNINYETKFMINEHNKVVHGEMPAIEIDMVDIQMDDKQSFEELECQYCGEEPPSKEVLAKHIAFVHPRQTTVLNEKGVKDDEVLTGFNNVGMLERDMNFLCTKCEKGYKTKDALKDHKRYKHGDTSTCTECSKVLGSKIQLGSHVRDSHGPMLHCCALCGKKFRRKFDLERHIVPCVQGKGKKSTCPDPDPKLTCEMCSKLFASKDSLSLHLRRKHDYLLVKRLRNTSWKCTKCSQAFRSNGELKNHMKVHNSSVVLVNGGGAQQEDYGNFVCQVCAQEFGSKSALGRHEKLVHPTLTFECHQCGKELPSKRSMKQHKSRMHNDTVFVCPLCLEEFRQRHNKNIHMNRCKERHPQSFKMLGSWEPTIQLQ